MTYIIKCVVELAKNGVPSSVVQKIPRFDTAVAVLQHTG